MKDLKNKKIAVKTIAILIAALAAVGCGEVESITDSAESKAETTVKSSADTSSSEADSESDSSAAVTEESKTDDESSESDEVDDTADRSQLTDSFGSAAFDFSAKLWQQVASDEIAKGNNVMISPQSVMIALGMTANGADGDTLEEMKNVLGGGMEMVEFNENMNAIIDKYNSSEDISFNVADSIWIRNDGSISVKDDFISTVSDFYDAQVYTEPFDSTTLDKINGWVNEKTDSMIPTILNEEIPDYAVMYLINAICFEAEWYEEYTDDQIVEDDTFTNSDGEEETVSMLYSTEGIYISCDNAQGFFKYYKGGDYAFVGLLPNDGISLSELTETLDGEALSDMFASQSYAEVSVCIPEFTADYDTELSDSLKAMGINEAFEESADFSAMGETGTGALYISRVLHKTHIEVDRKGTKAAAVTAVEMTDECEAVEPDPKTVYLNRPFLYAVIDRESGLPVFMGCVNTVE